jgi:hypothetical protein
MIKFNWERIQSIIIVILFIIILLMRQCGGKEVVNPVETKVITKVETKWDTVTVEEKVYVPKWRTKVETKYDTTFIEVKIPSEVDTLEILKDYYAQYEYKDTLYLDSLGYVLLTDTITQNSILRRKQVPFINIPTRTITVTEYINNREFYAGFGARSNGKNISWMGLEGVFRNKKGNIFIVGVGTDNENSLSLGGGVHWKINKD